MSYYLDIDKYLNKLSNKAQKILIFESIIFPKSFILFRLFITLLKVRGNVKASNYAQHIKIKTWFKKMFLESRNSKCVK